MVGLLHSPHKPTNEVLGDVTRDFEHTPRMQLELNPRVLTAEDFIDVVVRALREDEALERVRQENEDHRLIGKKAMGYLHALERWLERET